MSKLSDMWFRFLSKIAFFLVMQFFVLMDAASQFKLRLKATRLRITTIQYLKLIEKKNPTTRYTTKGMEHLKPAPGECRVCLSEFEEGEKLRKLKCNHTYHKECLDTWLQRWPTCPLCRYKVLPEDMVARYKHEQVQATLESEGSEDIPFLVGLFTWW